MTDAILPPRGRSAPPAGDAAAQAALRRARLLNLLGLVTPVANLGMTRTAARDLRWFGVGAGAVLLAMSAAGWFGGNPWTFALAAGAHAVLVLAGLVNPRMPEAAGRAWIALGKGMGHVVAVPLFAILYYAVVTPTALLVRLFVGDPLRRRAPRSESYWIAREPSPRERFQRQF